MDKLKNVLNPGANVDNEILYGARSSDTAGAADSSGRHTGDSDNTTGVAPGTQHSAHGHSAHTAATPSSSDPHSSQYDKTGTASSHAPSAAAAHVTSSPHNHPSNVDDDASETTHHKSGLLSRLHPRGHSDRDETETNTRPSNVDDDASGTSHHNSGLLSKLHPHGQSNREEAEAGPHHNHRDVQPEYSAAAGTHQPNNPFTRDVNKPLPEQPRQSAVSSGTGPAYGALPDRTSESERSNVPAALGAGVIGGATAAAYGRSHHNSGPDLSQRQALPGEQSGAAGSGYSATGSATQPLGTYPPYTQPQAGSGPQNTGLGYPLAAPATHTFDPPHPGAATYAGTDLVGTQQATQYPSTKYPSEAQALPSQSTDTSIATPYYLPHGPHHTFTADLLDPHSREHRRHHDTGRAPGDVAVTGSTGAGHRDSPGSSAGPTPSTSGPHKSGILNKLDPRVDSDLDRSRTVASAPGKTDHKDIGHAGLTGSGHPAVGRGLDHGGPEVGPNDYPAGSIGQRPIYADTGAGDYHGGSIGQKPIYVGVGTDDHPRHDDQQKHEKGGKTGLLGFLHKDEHKDKDTASAPVLASSTPKDHAAHDGPRHEEKKQSGLLGFLHKDDDKAKDTDAHHHHGRDAALAGGALGAGAAAYETGRRPRGTDGLPGSAAPEFTTGAGSAAHDDRHDEKGGKHGLLGFLHKGDEKHKSTDPHPSGHNHHHDRDVAFTGGAAGAGTTAYDTGRHQRGTDGLPGSVPPGDTTAAAHGHGHEDKGGKHGLLGFLHKGDDKHKSADVHPSDHDHHYGRDATLAGATVGAGAAAYDAGRRPRGTDGLPGSVAHGDTTTAANDHRHDEKDGKHGLLGFLHKGDDKHKSTDVHPSGQDHHHGRDVAFTGGTAGVGAAAYDTGRHPRGTDGLPGSVPPRDTTGASSAATHEQHRDTKEGKHGLLGFLHKGDDKRKSTDTQPPHAAHGHGRDAVLAGSAAAAGATAYGVGKHHRGTDGLPSTVPTNETATPAGATAGHPDAVLHDQHQHDKEGKRSGLLGFLHKDDDRSRDNRHDVVAEEPAEEKHNRGLFGSHYDDDKHKDKHHKEKAKEKEEKHHSGLFGSHHDDDKHKHKHHDKVKEKETEEKHHGGLFGSHHDDDKHKDKHHDKAKEREKEKHHGGLFGSHHDDDKHKDKHHEKIKEKEKEDKHHGGLFGTHHDDDKHKDKHHEKEKEKDEKHHGGLLGLFHHDKDKTKEKHHDGDAVAEGNKHGHQHQHQHHERNRLHKDPPKDYLAKMQGSLGTGGDTASDTASDPAAAGQRGVVTEPHTGLPMDVGKHGSGAGGTDGGPAPGYHQH